MADAVGFPHPYLLSDVEEGLRWTEPEPCGPYADELDVGDSICDLREHLSKACATAWRDEVLGPEPEPGEDPRLPLPDGWRAELLRHSECART